ncbi:MAG: hypothetical protein QOG43_1696 [Actinomycetota bacterium]|jgi:hypothetical protein|nr:hypothetical protein [Actinomycetota bacterium]
MTPRTRTETRSTPLRSPHQAVGLFLGAAILAVLIVAPSLAPASFVARLAIDNPTAFDINVDVANGDGGGWFPLGTLDRETESVLEEVVDPGAMWLFHFSYGGVEGGELAVSRAELRGAGWQLAVPPGVSDRLAAAGLVASAR